MSVEIKRFVTGPLETNTYVISDNGMCLVVDPSSGSDAVIDYIARQKLLPEAIVLTHGHFDHIMGIPEIQARFPGVKVWVHPDERIVLTNADYNGSPMLGRPFSYKGPLSDLKEGQLTIGSFSMTVLLIPGHSPGGCALLFDDQCICGDIIFAGSVGRSDFPGGDGEKLIAGIRSKLLTLPEYYVLHPGHGGRTTIGREKKYNPFLEQ